MKKRNVFILICILWMQNLSLAQVITIAAARAKALGTNVTITGIATNGAELGSIRYIQDSTGAIAAYGSIVSTVNRGDSVEVTGTLDDYNDLLELSPVSNVKVLGTNKTLPQPVNLSLTVGFAELYEGMLVEFDNVFFTVSGNFSTSNSNYFITDGSASKQVRVLSSTDLAGTAIPLSNVNIIGIMSQYMTSYQMLPRDLNDIIVSGNPPVIISDLKQTNIAQTGFTVSFETQNPGSTVFRYGLTNNMEIDTIEDATLITSHSKNLSGLTPATVYYIQAVTVSSSNDTSFSMVKAMMTASQSSGDIKIYFNYPVDTTVAKDVKAINLGAAIKDTVIYYIGKADSTLEIFIYNINDPDIVSAINAADASGVTVRLIAGDSVNASAYNDLSLGTDKKKSPSGSDYSLMHNKILIIDANSSDPSKPVLLTGSLNFTTENITTYSNNITIIQDQSLAKAYLIEFEEMWNGTFGQYKSNNTPHEFNINGKRVELYFSPSDGTNDVIANTLNSAENNINFAVYVFTRTDLAYKIQDKVFLNGVDVRGILNEISSGGQTTYDLLKDAMENKLILTTQSYTMHNKYAIVDHGYSSADPLVLTGSHNWTTSANTKNDENTLIIHDSTIANIYYQEFAQRYKENGGSLGSSIEENINSTGFYIFPNPARDGFVIAFSELQGKHVNIEVFEITGKRILYQEMEVNTANSTGYFSTQALTKGIYFIRIINGENVYNEKLIVTK